jgi:hypothetical protein
MRAQAQTLRDRANAALEVAMGYVRSTARGPVSRK